MVPMISSKEKRFLVHGFTKTLLSVSHSLYMYIDPQEDLISPRVQRMFLS